MDEELRSKSLMDALRGILDRPKPNEELVPASLNPEDMLQAGVPIPGASVAKTALGAAAPALKQGASSFFEALRQAQQLKKAKELLGSGTNIINPILVPKLP